MKAVSDAPILDGHSHIFLGTGHEKNERKTWGVIALCGVMMVVEIVGGTLFGSWRWWPTACTCQRMREPC
jgi:Co/Zn/Cd efflux system component